MMAKKNWTPLSRLPFPFKTTDPDPFSSVPSFTAVSASLLSRPWIPARKTFQLTTEQSKAMAKIIFASKENAKENAKELLKKDRRFSAEEWSDYRRYTAIALSYLSWREGVLSLIQEAPDLDEQTRLKAKFFAEQIVDMLSPSNNPFLNPQVLNEAKNTRGKSLVNGFKNWLHDVRKGSNTPTQSEEDAFIVGENIANTPGKVVARNHLCELIQYEPTTKKVQETPILIIPPWINKFYILDLGEKKSYIRHLVAEGYTVFMISWKNPTAAMADTSFDDYVIDGTQFAKEVIADITGVSKPAAIGYCIGGTLLATAQAYFKAKNLPQFSTLTFFTTMVDFDDVGEVKLFIDERSIRHIEQNMNQKGYLEGSEMGSTFAYLRAKDLLWNYFVDNYLLGKTPKPFDILSWNADSTRMPATMHSWYLRNMYLNNLLRVPGALEINGAPIDLTSIEEDIYMVGCETDHIAPAKTVYKIRSHTRAKVTYVLGFSGHIAGIINPPAKQKGYHYTSEPVQAPNHTSFDEWKETAQKQAGSWWTHHNEWLQKRTGKTINARKIGSKNHPAKENAPGTYVFEK